MTFAQVQNAHCAAHSSAEIDCVAACDHLTETARTKKFKATKRTASAVKSAVEVPLQNVRHVTGDVPTHPDVAKINRMLDAAGAGVSMLEQEYGITASVASTPLQQPLTDGTEPFTAAPAHLSSATVARGFILAGNAYFTVRSLKTGVRYTYRVNRADCSRCGKRDCQCWKWPTYFVALLNGPDNTGDYTYLGMLRENQFRLTRASKMDATSKPVAAFRWVWTWLEKGIYPAFTEIWHEGRCGRCGRKLTVPESIAAGIGPDCAGRL